MKKNLRSQRRRSAQCAVLAAAAAYAYTCAGAAAAGSLELTTGGVLAIDGRQVACKPNIQTILDTRLPNLGIATRSQLVLNPNLLRRMSPTVRLFVYHHECGHHHVGGDELGADCWAVKSGVKDGWLRTAQLGEICTSFGNSKATATHPAAAQRCKALHACFAAASRAVSQTASAPSHRSQPDPSAPTPELVHEGFAAPLSTER